MGAKRAMKALLGTKIGMTQIIGEDGAAIPVTLIQAGPVTVTQVKSVESDGYNAVQVAYGERCGTEVVQKSLEQWYWNITKYSQQLLDGLNDLDWPNKTKLMQQNWIGRSEGVNIKSKVKDLNIEFEVYDSVPQTFMAQTFTVIAPEHPMVKELVKGTKYEKDVMDFVEKVKRQKSNQRKIKLKK
jgi:leucyl-tRNA synthetase